MKLTGPNDIIIPSKEEKILEKIEKEFEKGHSEIWFDLKCDASVTIEGEYTKSDRDAVAEKYVKTSWAKVTHKTSSENGERPGLTSFIFYK